MIEKQKAERIIQKYREKYMCSMGPIMDGLIKKALYSEDGRKKLQIAGREFINGAYFDDSGINKLPLNTKEILGFNIWEGKCKTGKVDLVGKNDTLLGRFYGKVIVQEDFNLINEKHLDNHFFVRDYEHIIYKYHFDIVFINLEQLFLYIRAFWYFIESAVISFIFNPECSNSLSNYLNQYNSLRKSLVSPFTEINFPQLDFFNKTISLDRDFLNNYYYKYFFSRMGDVQKKSLLMAMAIKNEYKSLKNKES
ncbi:MAG: hypothetical protein ACTSRA_22300 [Promethearchaeota archaeon]